MFQAYLTAFGNTQQYAFRGVEKRRLLVCLALRGRLGRAAFVPVCDIAEQWVECLFRVAAPLPALRSVGGYRAMSCH